MNLRCVLHVSTDVELSSEEKFKLEGISEFCITFVMVLTEITHVGAVRH